VDPIVSRKTWKTLEPVHAMIYFAPEGPEQYGALGFDVVGNRACAYFPPRAAAMGAVSPSVVQAAFFNFSALAVQFGMAGAWDVATPAALIEARYRAADAALRRLCGDLLDAPTSSRRSSWRAPRARRAPRRAAPSTPGTPTWTGPPRRTCSCSTPSPCCASSAATGTSRP
jgi:hypothetical protein